MSYSYPNPNPYVAVAVAHNIFGDRIKIMWEKQLVGPLIHYLTSVIVP